MLKQLAKSNGHRKGVTQKLFLAGIVALLCLMGTETSSTFSEKSASAVNTSTGNSRISVTLSGLIALRVLDSTATTEINSLNIDITPTPNGVFNKNSMMVEVSTPNTTGYKLYMTSIGTNPVDSTSGAYTTDLINLDSSISDSIPTLASGASVTEADFRVRNSLYKNKWGYSLNGYSTTQAEDDTSPSGVTNTVTELTDISSITYANIPTHGTNIEIGSNNTAATKKLTPVTIGVNASSAIPAGTYQNTLEYTAIANPIPKDFTLYFDKNTEDAVSDFPETMTVASVASSYTFTIPDTAPSRDGYELSEYNTAADGSGDSYQPGDEFTITADDSDPDSMAKTLYAIWEEEEDGLKDFWHIKYMQEMTPEICAAETTPIAGVEVTGYDSSGSMPNSWSGLSTTLPDTDGSHHGDANYVPERQLYDWRGADGTGAENNKAKPSSANAISYTVRKLADGNCWMTENLKLPLSTSKSVEVVVNETGEIVSEDRTDVTYGNIVNGMWTPAGGCGYEEYCPMNGNTMYDSTYDSWYYTWYAATAGSGTASIDSDDHEEASYSICPKGWRLQYNYHIRGFSLVDAYLGSYVINTNNPTGYEIMEAFPLNFLRAGYVLSGSYNNSLGQGFYWSSSAEGQHRSGLTLRLMTTSIRANDGFSKYIGLNVRCVAV